MQFHRTESLVLSSGQLPIDLEQCFLLSMSRNVLEFISKFQIFFEKPVIFVCLYLYNYTYGWEKNIYPHSKA